MHGKYDEVIKLAMLYILGILILVNCSSKLEQLTNIPENPFQAIKPLVSLTNEEAMKWHSDFYIYWVNLNVDVSNINGIFAYRSIKNPGEYLLVFVEGEGSGVVISSKSQYFILPMTQGPPIILLDLPFDSPDIWLIALSAGGNDYITNASNDKNYSSSMLLIRDLTTEERVLEWIVSFTPMDYRTMDIYINAQTGEVIEVRYSGQKDGG